MRRLRHAPLAALATLATLALAACHSGSNQAGAPGDGEDFRPFSGIGEEEAVHFTGTEPFWNGEAKDGRLRYATPEDADGQTIAVNRFAGRNGLSFSGQFDGQDFVLAVTPGKCSDGMSDRTYPYVATLMVRGEQREGCAWTTKQPDSDNSAQ